MQFGVSESISHWGKYRPGAIALYCNGQRISYSDLDQMVSSISGRLQSELSHCRRIAVATSEKSTYLASIVAVLRSGKSPVLLNTGLPSDVVRQNMEEAEVTALVHDEQYTCFRELIDSSDKVALNIEPIVLSERQQAETVMEGVSCSADEEWGVLFSSGSTGVPKGIERSHESVVVELLGWCIELALSRSTTMYVGRPVHYTGGLVLTLATLLAGGSVILNDFEDDNDSTEAWEDYQRELSSRERVDWAFFVPDQIRAFLEIVRSSGKLPRHASHVLIMGAPISGSEKRLAKEFLLSEVVESWGNSESLGTITDAEDLEIRPDSIGRPFITDMLCVVNDEYEEVGPRVDGWIAGSEEAGFTRYCRRDSDTDRVKQGTLIVSEDIGYIDEQGYFYVRGRSQESIYLGSQRVFLPELEEKIRSALNVSECCIVASEHGEASVSLVLVLSSYLSEREYDENSILSQVNAVVGDKQPVAGIAVVERLPRLPSGKVDRIRTRQLLNKEK